MATTATIPTATGGTVTVTQTSWLFTILVVLLGIGLAFGGYKAFQMGHNVLSILVIAVGVYLAFYAFTNRTTVTVA